MKHTAIINLDAPGPEISKHIYGHFSEHLGNCIYGGFYVGEDSPVPNVRGMRKDVIEAFKRINIPNLRWPGGCFADEYHWMDGIGPKTSRPEMINTHWGGVVENNHFGTHEFLDLCELLETEPYITGNLGSGSVQEMSQWIEYMTFDGKSPMTELRKKNGREKPWKVKYWGLGNENWGCGGNMTAQFYADQAKRYGTYCRSYGDNKLYKIACGANSIEYDWTETIMRNLVACPTGNCPADRFIKGISLHYYTIAGDWNNKGSALDDQEEKWLALMKKSCYVDALIARHKSIMDYYDPKKKIDLLFDEWGTWHDVEEGTNPGFLFQQNTIRDALVASVHFDIFHKHADRIHMTNIAQAVNVLQAPVLIQDNKLILTPTYHVFEMNKGHHDAVNLPVYMNEDIPKAEFESESFSTLSLSASRKSGHYLVSLSNIDYTKDQNVSIDLRGAEVRKITGRILSAAKHNSHNSADKPNEVVPVAFTDFKLNNGAVKLTIPAHSFITLDLD
ncbi:MAG: alpha-N-arabinofuranosidase [Spirochaetales bacterium]|nr:alpha-N-arabinofuranosidase [Spirochaetales bacterium]